jgi:hypothetical protein
MVALVPPGPMSPLSKDPSFITMRWTVLSMLRHTTRLPCVMGAGLGLNDWAPLWPMMLTVAAPFGAVLGVGVGMPGAFDPAPPLPLQPHAAKTKIAPESHRNRMTAGDYASRMPGRSIGVSPVEVRASSPRDLPKPYRLTFFRRFQLSIRYLAR